MDVRVVLDPELTHIEQSEEQKQSWQSEEQKKSRGWIRGRITKVMANQYDIDNLPYDVKEKNKDKDS